MIATHYSHCAVCNHQIVPGDEIKKVNDKWIHAHGWCDRAKQEMRDKLEEFDSDTKNACDPRTMS